MLISLITAIAVLAFLVGLLSSRVLDEHSRGEQSARLQAIEGQLAALKTNPQRPTTPTKRDLFANPTTHEEPDEWRNT